MLDISGYPEKTFDTQVFPKRELLEKYLGVLSKEG